MGERVSLWHGVAGSNPVLSGGPCVPEPIQSVGRNVCEYDPSQDVSSAAPAPKPNAAEPKPPPDHPPGVNLLVSKNPPAAAAPPQCVSEKAALIIASSQLLRSAGAMTVAAPTLLAEVPAIAAFVASAIAVGATAAQYANCTDKAAAMSNAK
jgi:hypothetical protein